MTVLPGQTIGILGGGQLGRMLTLEARRMGYRVIVMDPDPVGPAAQVADECIHGNFDDVRAAERLASYCDVLTVETEHISPAVLDAVAGLKPLRPSAETMKLVQDRKTQKEFLERLKIPQTPWSPVDDLESLGRAVGKIGTPSVLKTRRSGYDGKGQAKVTGLGDIPEAWEKVRKEPSVLEAFVKFKCEISIVLARDTRGRVVFYPVAENVHRNHVLHLAMMPGRIPKPVEKKAQALAARIARGLNHVGVMAVEMFLLPGGKLLVNEIAPRTHNSGHPTFGAGSLSQFELHLRAIVGLPVVAPRMAAPAVIVNLLGDLWKNGKPVWEKALSLPGLALHLYGKSDARPGRKMGHMLVTGKTAKAAAQVAERALALLKKG